MKHSDFLLNQKTFVQPNDTKISITSPNNFIILNINGCEKHTHMGEQKTSKESFERNQQIYIEEGLEERNHQKKPQASNWPSLKLEATLV